MNNRDYKQYGAGEYYHIYNRGNGKENIFINNEDYRFFISRLKQILFPNKNDNSRSTLLPSNSFSLISYCLMPNHFHLLLRQNGDIPTSKLLLKLCTSYSIYFNKKYNHVGHVFQDRFKQVWVSDDRYLRWLSCYIHQNPKVAGFVKNLANYIWSSYCEYTTGGSFANFCDKTIILDQFKNIKEYRDYIDGGYEIIKRRKDLEYLLLDA